MAQEDAIVVNPPQELETNNESETVQVDGPRGTADARTGTEPQAQRTYTFTKHDIKAIADEALQEAIDKGEFDDIVEANPTIEGSEPNLESLKVGSTKYQIPSGTNVVANPTLAGTESALTGLEVGSTKYKVEQPTNVQANPTLAGTENELTGLQVGTTKFAIGKSVGYLTSAPNAANTSGRLIFVVLSAEPATKYDGYIYLITEA